MSLLNGVSSSADVQEEKDFIGGFKVFDSAVYAAKIKLAYLQEAASGALGLHLVFETSEGDLKQTFYVTSGTAKGKKNYFTNRKGENQFLPGWNNAEALTLLTVGKDFSQMASSTEEKTINLYSPDAKAEVPTKVEMVTDLLNQEIKLGVIKQERNKSIKGEDGNYHPTAEIQQENEIDKIFRASDNMTTAEIRAQATEAQFMQKWVDKWEGKVKDRTSKDVGTSGAPSPNSSSSASKPTKSLFS